MKSVFVLLIVLMLFLPLFAWSQTYLDKDGVLVLEGKRRFVIGCYHNPKDPAVLKEFAKNGINLVHCAADVKELDMLKSAGLYGWINTGGALDLGVNPTKNRAQLEQMVNLCKGHPALAVWEAPDEALWNITWEQVQKKFYSSTSTEAQQDSILAYHAGEVKRLSAGFKAGVNFIKSLDPQRPIWFNHAPRNTQADLAIFSALADIAGCDIYPVALGRTGHSDLRNVNMSCVGEYTDLMQSSAPGKPVWMVLQAFSWEHLLHPEREQVEASTFPTFAQSRFMAYDAILHGAKGILYWGSFKVSPRSLFWQSILQVTREIAALEPFLTSPELKDKLRVEPIAFVSSMPTQVAYTWRKFGGDDLIVVQQEDNEQYVEVGGLEELEDRELFELGTPRVYRVRNGRIRVNHAMSPHVLCTSKKYKVHSLQEMGKVWDETIYHPLQTR